MKLVLLLIGWLVGWLLKQCTYTGSTAIWCSFLRSLHQNSSFLLPWTLCIFSCRFKSVYLPWNSVILCSLYTLQALCPVALNILVNGECNKVLIFEIHFLSTPAKKNIPDFLKKLISAAWIWIMFCLANPTFVSVQRKYNITLRYTLATSGLVKQEWKGALCSLRFHRGFMVICCC